MTRDELESIISSAVIRKLPVLKRQEGETDLQMVERLEAEYRALGPAALKAINDAGFAIVPREPTTKMYMAGKKAIKEAEALQIHSEAAWCFAAMIEEGEVK